MNNENLKHFEILNQIDVSCHIEKRKSGGTELSYLSWTWAWRHLKKQYPDAIYEVQKFNGLPYVFDPLTGYMVYTRITIENITHEMWLPVMDGANKAMKDKSYEYTTKFGKKTCEAATMFDINKTIMRCLVKNIAMFGLGLYVFAGEDLPEENENIKKVDKEIFSKPDFEITKQKILSSKDIKELQEHWNWIKSNKFNFTIEENKELENIKNSMKNELEKM